MNKNKKIYNFIGMFILVFSLFSFVITTSAEVTLWGYTYGDTIKSTQDGFPTYGDCEINRTLYINDHPAPLPTPSLCKSYISAGYPAVNNPYEISPKKVGEDIKFNETYKLLAPIGDFDEIKTNDIGKYFNTFLSIAIGLAGALAVVMIIIGGIEWMGTDSVFGKTKARERITSAILGLLIALGSYALLNTINPDLLGRRGLNIDRVEIELDPNVYGDDPQTSPTNGYYCNGRAKAGEIWGDDTKERNAVKTAGITIQRSNSCEKVGDQNCTSLTGLNTTKVINFKKSICPSCDVVINGGTECWLHSPGTTHYKGNSFVDLDNTNSLIKYVQGGQKKKVKNTNLYVYDRDGITFLDEGNHYHIINW